MLTLDSIADSRLIDVLRAGGIASIPTDTVYGLAALAGNSSAVARLYKLKNREHKPGTVIAASIDQLVELGIKRRYLKAVEHMWPGAISIVIPTGSGLSYLDQGKGSLAMRIVANPKLLAVLNQTGPLLTTSVNLPGKPPAGTVEEAKKCFEDKVDAYVDGGNLAERQPSTVIRIVDDAIEILRVGAVKINERGEIEK